MAVTGGVALVVGGVVGTSFRDVDGSNVEAPEPSGGAGVLVAAVVAVVGAVVEAEGTGVDDDGLLVVVDGWLLSPPPHAAVNTLSAMTAPSAANFEPCRAIARVEITPRTSCGITASSCCPLAREARDETA